MSTQLIIGVIVVIAIVAVAAWWVAGTQRTSRLRERFGPEYDRAVRGAQDRDKAESELQARQERVEGLEIRPLEPAARDRFASRWQKVQALFVDDPRSAVSQADALIGEVMAARGYPMSSFEQRVADISVDHPHVVDHYRIAHAITVRQQTATPDTEQLRQAIVHYRALFADLLETPDATPSRDEPIPPRARKEPEAAPHPEAVHPEPGREREPAPRS